MLHFWQDFGFSLLLAYVMYILIEAPCGGLESTLLPNRRPRDTQNITPAEVPAAKEPESQRTQTYTTPDTPLSTTSDETNILRFFRNNAPVLK